MSMRRHRLKAGTGNCYTVIQQGKADMADEQMARDQDRKKTLGL
jgi:hypothetical protein